MFFLQLNTLAKYLSAYNIVTCACQVGLRAHIWMWRTLKSLPTCCSYRFRSYGNATVCLITLNNRSKYCLSTLFVLSSFVSLVLMMLAYGHRLFSATRAKLSQLRRRSEHVAEEFRSVILMEEDMKKISQCNITMLLLRMPLETRLEMTGIFV